MRNPVVNRENKDSLFRMLFSEKEELLSLYNAIRGTNYEDTSLLDINTLDGVIYLSVKNDLSFVLDNHLSIYEHQSTWCGNMPLRNLVYITNIFSNMTASNNVFGSEMIKLPNPHFVTFYNGKKKIPDRLEERLSQTYEHPEGEVNLELVVTVLNINHGYNEDLMRRCPTLREYAFYVESVRVYSKRMPIEEAVEMAIQHCIKNNVLADFLRKHRAEVKHVCIFEYDAEKHLEQEIEAGEKRGEKRGEIKGMVRAFQLLGYDTEEIVSRVSATLEVEEEQVRSECMM